MILWVRLISPLVCQHGSVLALLTSYDRYRALSVGQRLAVVANDSETSDLKLRIYDIRAPPKNISSFTLESTRQRNSPFSDASDDDSAVGSSVVSFSPDGIYVAVGRDDNVAQVLDSRFATKEMLYCRHEAEPPNAVPGVKQYGVTMLDWLDAAAGPLRSKNVLVTGGDDGEALMFSCLIFDHLAHLAFLVL